jgi:hypothetical protein
MSPPNHGPRCGKPQGSFGPVECKIPSGYVKIAIENGPVEIVDLPIDSMVIFIFSIVMGQFTRG